MAKTEIRMTGSGGQGVIMGTIIIAEAAYEDGKHVVQCQAYGPEARGGSSKAKTIVSDEKITYTKVIRPDLLLALTAEGAANGFSGQGCTSFRCAEESALVNHLIDQAIPAGFLSAHIVVALRIRLNDFQRLAGILRQQFI